MSRLLIALGAFIGTISIIWVLSSPSGDKNLPSSLPQARQADIYLHSGTQLKKVAVPPSSSPTPTASPSPMPTLLLPQTILTPSALPSATHTPVPTATPTDTPLSTPAPTSTPTLPPTPTATPESEISLTLLELTTPVAQKQTAVIKIQSAPTAQCTIEATLPSKKISTSKDLNPKTADEDGIIAWSWYITWNTQPGTVTLKFSCTKDSQSTSGEATMQIVSSQ